MGRGEQWPVRHCMSSAGEWGLPMVIVTTAANDRAHDRSATYHAPICLSSACAELDVD